MSDIGIREPDSAKQRSRRIPLDYHRRLTRLDLAKWCLTGLAAAAAAAYCLWTLAGWLGGKAPPTRQFSPAPLAAAHAMWDAQCAACHVAGTSLRADAQATALVSALLAGKPPADRAALDARCQACHAGPAHHANQIESEVQSCAGCHREHQGLAADLKRVASAVCTNCHSDIERHRTGQPDGTVSVTAFPSEHPKFRSLVPRNLSRLKFNHALHMLPGQYPAGAKAGAPTTLDDIDENYREGFFATIASDDVRRPAGLMLSCEYCHQSDDSARPLTPRVGKSAPASGDYMQPINFERHCAACHNGDLVAEVAVDGPTIASQLPHGLAPDEIRQFLAGLTTQPE
jgi:predicted CXXCH cytochrome family protein